ncbi:MAG: plasmid mobilization relaxosome protein MobC [Eubacterium sp.]|nr:plasmid mobilization relaxosome protein MobC [Eubacterium sp.]
MSNGYDRWQFKRPHSVNLKLNDYEDDMLRIKAAKTGKNKSEYLRELICSSCPTEAPPKKFYTACNELNKIGVNINQIAARANSNPYIDKSDVEFIKGMADEIFDRLSEIKKIVKQARPYAVSYFELVAIKQREARLEGRPEPQIGDDISDFIDFKYEDEPDDVEVESLYEVSGADKKTEDE